jgi:hypothetical protein
MLGHSIVSQHFMEAVGSIPQKGISDSKIRSSGSDDVVAAVK